MQHSLLVVDDRPRYWRLRDRLRRLRRDGAEALQALGDERYRVAVGIDE